MNAALHRIFVKASEHFIQFAAQIKNMQVIHRSRSEAIRFTRLTEIPVNRTDFQISQILNFYGGLQVANQEV
jgi:hypothetical protein